MTNDEATKLAHRWIELHTNPLAGKSCGCDKCRMANYILSGDMKREIENAALYLPADKINDLQLFSIKRLIETLKWSHHADIAVRRDGQDHHFEADWLKHVITPAKTADTEG